ncbi:hypothetical protein R1flu_016183 [Riccia fluitans]|uniref:Uncharacterized protein n=1 Tax=Riccia fluitans TaxID=41844 RepID=A0ABD1YP63_9MARC
MRTRSSEPSPNENEEHSEVEDSNRSEEHSEVEDSNKSEEQSDAEDSNKNEEQSGAEGSNKNEEHSGSEGSHVQSKSAERIISASPSFLAVAAKIEENRRMTRYLSRANSAMEKTVKTLEKKISRAKQDVAYLLTACNNKDQIHQFGDGAVEGEGSEKFNEEQEEKVAKVKASLKANLASRQKKKARCTRG